MVTVLTVLTFFKTRGAWSPAAGAAHRRPVEK